MGRCGRLERTGRSGLTRSNSRYLDAESVTTNKDFLETRTVSVPTITLTDDALHGIGPFVASFASVPQTVKLGRKPPTVEIRKALHLSAYLDLAAITLPETVDYHTKSSASLSRMYLNDQYGDCVIAGKYHTVGVWSGNDGPATVVGTDAEVLASYHAICGAGDNGCVITEVLDAMKSGGLPFNGVRHGIDGYVAVDWTNREMVKAALYLFGNITLGINLPSAWTSASTWDVTTSGIVGGHDVAAVGYRFDGVVISSWGKLFVITWAAFTSRKWLEEAWVLLGPDWYGSDKVSPSGVNVAALQADLAAIGQGKIPTVDPTPTPTPTPVGPFPAESDAVGFRWGNKQLSGIVNWNAGSADGVLVYSARRTGKAAGILPKGINWAGVLADLFAISTAVMRRDVIGAIKAGEQLIVDLGGKDPTPGD